MRQTENFAFGIIISALCAACNSSRGGNNVDNTITLKFLRVNLANAHSTPFVAALNACIALGAPSTRERNVNAGFPDPIIVRLESLEVQNDFLSGELIRKQVANIPPEANDDGLSPIQLSDGAGLGLSSAFRYHAPTRILLIQANNQAVSHNRLGLYLKSVDENAEYEFDPVPRRDSWDRFNRGLPRKLMMKVASPEHVAGLDQEADTVGTGVANIGEALRGAYITIEVSMGQKRGSLLKGATERVLRQFRRMSAEGHMDVKMLSASISDEQSTDVIDFLDEHLIVRDRLELPDGEPQRNYAMRADFLRTSFQGNLPYLNQHYRQ